MFTREIQQVRVVQRAPSKKRDLRQAPWKEYTLDGWRERTGSLHKRMQRTKSTRCTGTKDFGEAALAPKLADGGSM